MEEQANDLAQKAEAATSRLAEREAVYKRRRDAGIIDGGTYAEIERLKKEVGALLAAQAIVEEVLEAGPPASLFTAAEPRPVPVATAPESPPVAVASSLSPHPPRASAQPPIIQLRPLDGSKPVRVQGYYRKDGTYVRPHTRSFPRR